MPAVRQVARTRCLPSSNSLKYCWRLTKRCSGHRGVTMKRRDFMTKFAAASGVLLSGIEVLAQQTTAGGVVIERARTGTPHAGKVLVAIQPHSDDIPLFAAGTVAKLIREGYTGHLVRVTNDDMAGPGTFADTVLANERDTVAVAQALGVKKTYNLNYNNHRMNGISQ